MLDAYIIEELRRREEAERVAPERPRLELPVPEPRDEPERRERPTEDEDNPRGVVIIEL